MIARLPEPHRTLTQHFFRGFFRFSFLDEAGEQSVTRAMLGGLTVIICAGFVVARLYAKKYAMLSQQPTADLYLLMLPADQMQMIVLPMVLVAFIMALVSQSMFPDELDYRVLMQLPLSRRAVFESKALAFVLFAGIFIVASNVVIGGLFGLISGGRWAEHNLLRSLPAQLIGGLSASLFACVAIVAFQGIVVLLTPKRWLRRVLVAVQTFMICELVMILPAAFRVPHLYDELAAQSLWMFGVAPAWFLGIQRWIEGDGSPFYAQLAAAGLIASAIVTATAGASYLVLYRRFDRVTLAQQVAPKRANWPARAKAEPTSPRHHPAYVSIRTFTAATLGRSGAHQLIVCGALAAGIALAINSVAGSWNSAERWFIRAAVGAPLTTMIVAVLGMRAALLWPENLRAAWIFRLTETAEARPRQLNAVRQAFWFRGGVVPTLIIAVLQVALLGVNRTIAALPVIWTIGWILVDVMTHDWRRIPFTCTILFGKRPPAQMTLLIGALFFVFDLLGTGIVLAAISGPIAWVVMMTTLGAIGGIVRLIRMQTWGTLPLEFEDYLPDGLDTLKL
jgi:hypothetical protein